MSGCAMGFGGPAIGWLSLGAAAGGAGGVDSFNTRTGEVVPLAGDYTATQVTSTGPSTVQADLDTLAAAVALLQGSVTTGVKKIESWADFIALPTAVEAPAGTWTFSEDVTGAGTMVIPTGSKVVTSAASSISAVSPGGLLILGDVDDALLSGALVMQNVIVIQLSAGASAVAIRLSGTASQVQILQTMQVIGGRVGVQITAVAGLARVDTVISIDADIGFQVTGSVNEVALIGIASRSIVAGYRGVDVDASLVTPLGILIADGAFSLVPGQFGLSIAHGSTFTAPALMQISGASNSGPQDAMFRQTSPGVTDMAIDDNRLVVKGGPSVANWVAAAVASRFDLGDPIIVDTSTAGAGVNTIIPYEDGAGNTEIVASIESHFTLFKNPADPLDWYIEYTGPLTNATARLTSDTLADRASAGPSGSILSWTRAPFLDPGHGAFAAVPDSEIPWVNENRYKARTGTAISQGTNTFDRFRPVISDDSAEDVRLGDIKLELAIGS